MSQKRKLQRTNHAKKEEEQGKKAVMWVFGVIIALAIVYAIYTVFLVG